MTSVDVRRSRNKTKKIILKVSFRVLIVLLVVAVIISVKNNYFSKSSHKSVGATVSASNAIKKHAFKPKKKEAVVLTNQKTDDGVRVEDALVKDGKKTAYLTFDDGPSLTVTPRVLNTLKENNVHATFFLVGSSIENDGNGAVKLVHRIYDEGNAIGNHSYSHDMKILFPNNKINVQTFMNEVDKTENILKGILGPTFYARPLRVPGGYMSRQHYNDPNLKQFDEAIKKGNFASIDWNAYGFDAEGRPKNYMEIYNNIKNSIGKQEKVVILMHDTYGKEQTANALPLVIQYLKSQGYEFRTLK